MNLRALKKPMSRFRGDLLKRYKRQKDRHDYFDRFLPSFNFSTNPPTNSSTNPSTNHSSETSRLGFSRRK